MKRKLYAKYNKRSRLIEFVFIDINDDEACYKFEKANIEAEEQNKFYNSDDYKLICLGVLEMEGESSEVGIIYDYKDDFPVIFDEIKDGQKPKYNETYLKNISINDKEKIEEIKRRAKI